MRCVYCVLSLNGRQAIFDTGRMPRVGEHVTVDPDRLQTTTQMNGLGFRLTYVTTFEVLEQTGCVDLTGFPQDIPVFRIQES